MKMFTIAELEAFSTIKAHTFRMWEKRYSIGNPERSSGNYRYYSIAEVQHLLHIALLNRCGFKISHLVNMDQHTLQQRISRLVHQTDLQCMYVHDLIIAMYTLDADKVEAILNDCIALWGPHITLKEIIFPFLERIQLFSCKNQIKEIHFVVPAIRKKMMVAIETTKPKKYQNKTALLFLPEGEHYDLLLLYCNYILKDMGITVWYMGTNVPIGDLINVSNIKKPDLLLTYVRPQQVLKVRDSLEKAVEHLPNALLYVTVLDKQEVKSEGKSLRYIHYSEVPLHMEEALWGT